MDQTQNRIRERAYQIWEETGGNADQNWLQAETEILQATTSVTRRDRQDKKQLRKPNRKQQTAAFVR